MVHLALERDYRTDPRICGRKLYHKSQNRPGVGSFMQKQYALPFLYTFGGRDHVYAPWTLARMCEVRASQSATSTSTSSSGVNGKRCAVLFGGKLRCQSRWNRWRI